jgi:hypothetical protein
MNPRLNSVARLKLANFHREDAKPAKKTLCKPSRSLRIGGSFGLLIDGVATVYEGDERGGCASALGI